MINISWKIKKKIAWDLNHAIRYENHISIITKRVIYFWFFLNWILNINYWLWLEILQMYITSSIYWWSRYHNIMKIL